MDGKIVLKKGEGVGNIFKFNRGKEYYYYFF